MAFRFGVQPSYRTNQPHQTLGEHRRCIDELQIFSGGIAAVPQLAQINQQKGQNDVGNVDE